MNNKDNLDLNIPLIAFARDHESTPREQTDLQENYKSSNKYPSIIRLDWVCYT